MDGWATRLTVRFRSAAHGLPSPEPTDMHSTLAFRLWRLAATIGPLAAIALTLAAGRRW